MKRIAVLTGVVVFALALLIPSAGWAMMCDNHEGKHSGHGNQHDSMQITDHRGMMEKIYGEYFAIQSRLADDSLEGVRENAEAISTAAGQFRKELTESSGHRHEDEMNCPVADIEPIARSLAERKNLELAREDFGRMSEKMMEYHIKYGKEHMLKTHVFVCDMAQKTWLQDNAEPRNPYYGRAMLKCAREIK